MKNHTHKLFVALFTLSSPWMVLAQAPAVPAVSNDGPVYNFNFFNKGSIPGNGTVPLAPNGAPAVIPGQQAQQAPVPLLPAQTPADVKQDADANFNSFGVFYGYSETDLQGEKEHSSAGYQKINYSAHEVGLKKIFDNGFTIMPKYLFGKMNEKYVPTLGSSYIQYATSNKPSFTGYGLDLEQKLFKHQTLNLALGVSGTSISAKSGENFNSAASSTLKAHTVKVDSLLAIIRPQITISKNLDLSLLGGFGTSRTTDIDGHKYAAKTYRYGASLTVNF